MKHDQMKVDGFMPCFMLDSVDQDDVMGAGMGFIDALPPSTSTSVVAPIAR